MIEFGFALLLISASFAISCCGVCVLCIGIAILKGYEL